MPVEHSDPEEKVICSSVSSFYFFFLQLYDGALKILWCIFSLPVQNVFVSICSNRAKSWYLCLQKIYLYFYEFLFVCCFHFSICLSYAARHISTSCLLIPFLQRGISSLKGKVGDEKILDFALKVQPLQLYRNISSF